MMVSMQNGSYANLVSSSFVEAGMHIRGEFKRVLVWRRASGVKPSRALQDASPVRLALEAVSRRVLGCPEEKS
jgi:hypothetical protein